MIVALGIFYAVGWFVCAVALRIKDRDLPTLGCVYFGLAWPFIAVGWGLSALVDAAARRFTR